MNEKERRAKPGKVYPWEPDLVAPPPTVTVSQWRDIATKAWDYKRPRGFHAKSVNVDDLADELGQVAESTKLADGA